MADTQDKDDEFKKAVEDAVMRVKVDQLDRSVGHVVSTARLGYGFLGFLLAIAAILTAALFNVLTGMSDNITNLHTLVDRNNSAVSDLQNQIQSLQASLGTAPEELQEISSQFQNIIYELEERTARLEAAEQNLLPYRQDLIDIKGALVGPEATMPEDIEMIKLRIDKLVDELHLIQPSPA